MQDVRHACIYGFFILFYFFVLFFCLLKKKKKKRSHELAQEVNSGPFGPRMRYNSIDKYRF